MKLTKVSTGEYQGTYKGFEFSINKIKSRNWQVLIFISNKGKQITIPLNRSLSKSDAIEDLKKSVDNPSSNPALFSSLDFGNLSYENVEAFFVAPEYQQIQSPFMIKRIQKGKERYYTVSDDAVPKFYMSVTSFTSRALSNPNLSSWREKLGTELADKKSKDAADYGTFMHIQIGDFIKNGFYDFDALDDIVCDYIVSNNLDLSFTGEWINKIHNDLLSFAQFCIDKQVQTIAVEFPIVSDEFMLGGVIDYPCSLVFGGKRVNAIIDFKSGRKGFYDSHELQLKLYKDMWNNMFGDIIQMTHIFNWSPKDWRGCTPTYHLKNQTNGVLAHLGYVSIAQQEGWIKDPKPIKRGIGVVQLGQMDLKQNVVNIKMADYITGKKLLG